MNQIRLLRFLQNVDRRLLYSLMMLVIVLPFFFKVSFPVPISPQTRAFYNSIEALPPNSFVLLGLDWSAGTRGENRAQNEAILRHILRKHLRFAMLCFQPQARTLGQRVAEDLTQEYNAKHPDFKYTEGINWVNFGYKTDIENYLKTFILDIPGIVSVDVYGHPLSTLPVMKGIKTVRDIDFLIDITGTQSYETYIQFVQGPGKVPMGAALTAVMAPEAFNRLDSHQLVGLVAGLQGAVEYEQLIGVPGRATQAAVSSSFGHLLIILFIVLGNVAMVMERRQRARQEAEGQR